MSCLLIPTLSNASSHQVEYSNNDEKSFIDENKFYHKLTKEQYEEYKDATYSVRRKILYKEVPDTIDVFERKTGRYHGHPKQKLSTSIHPNRQVYFYASFVQDKDEEYWKHIIIDAETKQPLESGNSYHNYLNPYN
ncbi:hypothetical protein FZW96_20915 [Bacillus sp. BGMRC 2118]|nr:hypothetical protein FZW96_20915 [Bacillus sp. BGMRC 2118]